MNDESKCPVTGSAHKPMTGKGTTNRDWWPNQLNIKMLTRTLPWQTPWVRSLTMLMNLRNLTLLH